MGGGNTAPRQHSAPSRFAASRSACPSCCDRASSDLRYGRGIPPRVSTSRRAGSPHRGARLSFFYVIGLRQTVAPQMGGEYRPASAHCAEPVAASRSAPVLLAVIGLRQTVATDGGIPPRVSTSRRAGSPHRGAPVLFCAIGLRQTVAADGGIPPHVSTSREPVRRIAERVCSFLCDRASSDRRRRWGNIAPRQHIAPSRFAASH